MIRSSLFILIVAVMFSCADEKKKQEPEVKTVETAKFEHKAGEIQVSFQDERNDAVFASYVSLKTAFINTDASAAAEEASNLMTAFANIGVDEAALSAAQAISESSEIEEQRKAFVDVTAAVEKMLEKALDTGIIYKQYCPMAFGNTGAYWLSESKEIANPYFGDKMYRCGRVTDTIQ